MPLQLVETEFGVFPVVLMHYYDAAPSHIFEGHSPPVSNNGHVYVMLPVFSNFNFLIRVGGFGLLPPFCLYTYPQGCAMRLHRLIYLGIDVLDFEVTFTLHQIFREQIVQYYGQHDDLFIAAADFFNGPPQDDDEDEMDFN